jgi:hypothetical protein
MSASTALAIRADCEATQSQLPGLIAGIVDTFDTLTAPKPFGEHHVASQCA